MSGLAPSLVTTGLISGSINTGLIKLPEIGQSISQIGTAKTPETKTGGFWNFLGNLVNSGASILTGGKSIDLSKTIKLPEVKVDAGVNSNSLIKIGVFAIVTIIILKIFKVF
ncbi:hypothetical protein [Paraflavitalea sp. CAU 1676]|uniref:hypothetical protein n=1 Tax=Paraflavitalea sp. CAU 1676 TaxID=3032598 RepID=UPI0023DC10FF|nr:hypothetical protein [Paraflavitalea sp. CAU 1676]MDF2188950.1 hypothetical protein [Paraflavitalea sp. CAU 1676]